MQERRQIAKRPVLDRPGRSVENEKARGIAARRGPLRDPLGRQLVVEVGGLQSYLEEPVESTRRVRKIARNNS